MIHTMQAQESFPCFGACFSVYAEEAADNSVTS